ncbi:hypothetical protein [Nocardiopsis sp. FR26]|uniref:hypothetical protein n=1 Tax=Nocardiopsis sp. FR26 TaxID=2605987 RepID=UPI001F309A01|nr:hypothetical protein [Nocardiopsis sp. FR26]
MQGQDQGGVGHQGAAGAGEEAQEEFVDAVGGQRGVDGVGAGASGQGGLCVDAVDGGLVGLAARPERQG